MITPMEIQNHEFKGKFWGYEKESVKHFLFAVAEDFETLLEQNHEMAKELAVLRERVKDMESRDKVLKDTLITAQQVRKDIQENAEKEAELTLREAHLEAEKIHDSARNEVERIRLQMAEIRRIRNDLLAEAEMMVARFSHFVEAERGSAQESDKILRMAFAKPKEIDEPPRRRMRPITIKGNG